jgi:hypothetical protein
MDYRNEINISEEEKKWMDSRVNDKSIIIFLDGVMKHVSKIC